MGRKYATEFGKRKAVLWISRSLADAKGDILQRKSRSVFLAETKEESMSQQATQERIVGIGVLASLIAGLIAGISARIVMRIVALTAHLPPQFTVATLNVVFIGLIIGLSAGIVYSICVVALSSSPKVRKYLPGPMWRGLIFGVLILVIIGLPNLLGPSSPNDDINLGRPLLNRSMFAALPLIYGITLGGAEAILDRYLPRKPASLDGEIKSPTG